MFDKLYSLLTAHMVKTGGDPEAFHVNPADFDALLRQMWPDHIVDPELRDAVEAARREGHGKFFGIDVYAFDHIPPGEVVIVEQQAEALKALDDAP